MNHNDLDRLLELQEKDVQLAKLRRSIAAAPERKNQLVQQLEGLKQKALAAKQAVVDVEKEIQAVEAEIAAKQAYLEKTKTLQSNTRKNDEFQFCIQEICKVEDLIQTLEARELKLMDQLEQAKNDMTAKIQKTKDFHAEVIAIVDGLKQSVLTDKARVEQLGAERERLAAEMPQDSLQSYERLLKSKGAPVIVEMDEQGHCGACHMTLTANTQLKVQRGHELVYCDSCHRVLH